MINSLNSNLTNKFVVISGTTPTSMGGYSDYTFPNGFNTNNSVVISLEIKDGNVLRFWGNYTEVNAVSIVYTNSIIRLVSRTGGLLGMPCKIILMRTDI